MARTASAEKGSSAQDRIKVIFDHLREHPEHELLIQRAESNGKLIVYIECTHYECFDQETDEQWWDEWDDPT